MSIKNFFATKDNTITTAFNAGFRSRGLSANMGASDILEVYSIYAQASSSSLEKSRIIAQFGTDDILLKRNSEEIPASGSVKFFLKIYNAEHYSTTPDNFNLVVTPLLEDWTEGRGLDMETFKDLGASNWLSKSTGQEWISQGATDSDYVAGNLTTSSPAHRYVQYFHTGLEDLEIDITDITEQWLIHESQNSTTASATVTINSPPSSGDKIKLFSPAGDYKEIFFHTGSVPTSLGTIKTIFSQITLGNPAATRNTLVSQINASASTMFKASNGSGNQAIFEQKEKGYYGNTLVSSSSGMPITKQNFSGGTGIINRGILVKMSGSAESGADKVSYYTKKFFARNSQFFFKKPVISAVSEILTTDDRGNVYKSSSLMPASENLNKIYLYNATPQQEYVDIPSTGSSFLVSFHSSIGSLPVTMSGPSTSPNNLYVTASRERSGVYSAQFAYAGNNNFLYDVWNRSSSSGIEQILTGSGFSVLERKNNYPPTQEKYSINILDLKNSYNQKEKVTFRVFTKSKTSNLNIYTQAVKKPKASNIKELFFSLSRASDNLTIIPYTTASGVPKYSKLSYDMSGSFFKIDMSILEPNYLYEIAFLRKSGKNYIEQKEKFKFRIEK